jgi:bacteriocin biosynthesis cyclodehydratase domain-containing protein
VYAKDLQYIRVSDERAVLKRGMNELQLSGAGVHAILEPLLPMLGGGFTREQILDRYDEDLRPEVEKLLAGLVARNLAGEEAEPASGELSLASLQSSFWRNFGDAARAVPERLQAAHVVVVGASLISRAMVRSLLESGLGRVTLVDHVALNDEVAPPLFDSAGSERLARLPELPPDEELAEASLIVGTSDFGQADALLEINRAALRVKKPFLPVSLTDLVGYVGPLVQPFETACLRCYYVRTDSNNQQFAAARAVRKHAAAHPESVLSIGLLPTMPAMLGELAASEAVKFIAGYPPCDVVGRVIEMNLVSFAAVVRRVLKIPRCPDCSDIMTKASRALTLGPLIPYSE